MSVSYIWQYPLWAQLILLIHILHCKWTCNVSNSYAPSFKFIHGFSNERLLYSDGRQGWIYIMWSLTFLTIIGAYPALDRSIPFLFKDHWSLQLTILLFIKHRLIILWIENLHNVQLHKYLKMATFALLPNFFSNLSSKCCVVE